MSNSNVVASYVLRSKNLPLIDFSLCVSNNLVISDLNNSNDVVFDATSSSYSIKIDAIHTENLHLFPKNLSNSPSEAELLNWIKRRKAPKNRQFVEKIMSAIDDSENPLKYVDVSHALSLNDAYWITNNIMDYDWDKLNLYSHPFDEALSYVAFTGHSEKISGLLTSPEFTSTGMLKKCWSNREDGIYLLKGDDAFLSSDGRSQASLEYYAAQVAEAFGIEHIDYDLEEFHHRNGDKEIVCKCKLFTSEDIGFVDASTYISDMGIDISNSDLSGVEFHKKLNELFGQSYYDMMVFDSIIVNKDRHLRNFGMLVDNNTGEYLKPAPVFDNGYSLFLGAAKYDLEQGYKEYVDTLECKFFNKNKQAKLFVQERHLPRLRKLLEFEFKQHPKYPIDDRTVSVMSRFIQERAREIIALYHEKIADIKRVMTEQKILVKKNSLIDFVKKEHAKGKSFSRIEKAIKASSNFDKNTLALLNQIKNQADIKAIIDKEQEHSR